METFRFIEPPPRPLVLAAMVYIAGLAFGLNGPAVSGALFAGLIAASLALTAWGLWRARRIHGPATGSGALILWALALAGWWQGGALVAADARVERQLRPWFAEEIVGIEGVVAAEPVAREGTLSLTLRDVRVSSLRVSGPHAAPATRVTLRLMESAAQGTPPPLPGRRVRAWGRLRSRFDARSPSPFNSARYWRSRGVGARMTVRRAGDIRLGPPPEGVVAGFHRAMRHTRRWAAERLERRLGVDVAPLARALTLGDVHGLAERERTRFREGGLAHLIAVSGLHTGFVWLLLMGVALALRLPLRVGWAWSAVGLIAYALLTGCRPPVVRACVMAQFLLVGLIAGRRATGLSALAAAALATLVFDPRHLLRLDWQLSYACVTSILLMAGPLARLVARPPDRAMLRSPPRRWLRRWVALPLAVVFAIQLGLIPIQLHEFRRLHLLAPVSNLLSVPLCAGAVMSSLMTILLDGVPLLGDTAAWVAEWTLSGLTELAIALHRARWATLRATSMSAAAMAVWYGVLLNGGWLRLGNNPREPRWRRVSVVLRLAALAVLLCVPPVARAAWGQRRSLDWYLLDVGQGDGAVVRFPNGRVMVVDAGRAGQGRWRVAPMLDCLGEARIDALVLTHADADHLGGAAWLARHFRIDRAFVSPERRSTRAFAEWDAARRDLAIPTCCGEGLATLRGFDAVRVELFGPPPGVRGNNAGLALSLDYADVEILMTGDLECAGEQHLLAAGFVRDVEALKVGHHGSQTSSGEALLAAARPEVALISVGRRNLYHHPHHQVQERLERYGAQVARTDLSATLWLRTDGHRVEVLRYLGP